MSVLVLTVFVLFKQKTAYEMRISDWSSDVCSSYLPPFPERLLGRILVDLRHHDVMRNASGREQRRSRSASGCKHQHQPLLSCCSRQSRRRFMMAAAVSSIERRVTSITGQPLSANNRLAKASSAVTFSEIGRAHV